MRKSSAVSSHLDSDGSDTLALGLLVELLQHASARIHAHHVVAKPVAESHGEASCPAPEVKRRSVQRRVPPRLYFFFECRGEGEGRGGRARAGGVDINLSKIQVVIASIFFSTT